MSWGECEWGESLWGSDTCLPVTCDTTGRYTVTLTAQSITATVTAQLAVTPAQSWTLAIPGARCQSRRRQPVNGSGGSVGPTTNATITANQEPYVPVP